MRATSVKERIKEDANLRAEAPVDLEMIQSPVKRSENHI